MMPRPTCVVSPQPVPSNRGLTGLKNIGNTCFMNSIVQVLVNTTSLREYFQSYQFKEDLNVDNPLGSGGRLAIQFALLNRILWAGDRSSYSPTQLKNLVAEKATQFTGFAQHDAQEFLAFLLDGLHEDLNRIKIKPYIAETPLDHLPNEEAAAIAWQRHRFRNDSFIVDQFQAQYRSELVCLFCQKVSVTFDPYMYISVPIPKEQIEISLIVFPLNGATLPFKKTVSVPKGCGVKEICDALLNLTDARPCTFEFMQVKDRQPSRLSQSWRTNSYLYDDKSSIFAFEVETKASAGEEVTSVCCLQRLLVSSSACYCCEKPATDISVLRRCSVCHVALYCNGECQKEHWPKHKEKCKKMTPEVIGLPFIVSLPRRELTYKKLSSVVEACAIHSVNLFKIPANLEHRSGDGTLKPEMNKSKESLFFMKPVNSYGSGMIDGKAAKRVMDAGDNVINIPGSFLAIDWKYDKDKLCISSKELKYIEEEESENSTDGMQTASDTGLERCLHQFTKPETLSNDEAWYCPDCKTHRDATKQMSLWSLPDTLIFQLKRFSFRSAFWRDKIDDYISYPITGLDLSRFYIGSQLPHIPLYDLYGVVNHHGGMLGGHYTAYARCLDQYDSTITGTGWRLMDDSHVTYIEDEADVVNQSAYMLFYKKRNPSTIKSVEKNKIEVIAPSVYETEHQLNGDIKDIADSYGDNDDIVTSAPMRNDLDHIDMEDENLVSNLENIDIPDCLTEINAYLDEKDMVDDILGTGLPNSSENVSLEEIVPEFSLGTTLEENVTDVILDYTDMDAVD